MHTMTNSEQKIQELIQHFSNTLPHFPDGRIDYTNAHTAPVLTIFVSYEKKILLLKRSQHVHTYKGKWNTIAGYIDEPRPLKEKIQAELNEEIGLKPSDILSYHLGDSFSFTDENLQITWLVHPVIIQLKNPVKIILDWEHTEYTWIDPKDITTYDLVPNAQNSLNAVLAYL